MQFLKIHVFRGWILAILWPKVMKNYGVPKICVFLGRIFGISLAQSDEESWRSQNSCLSGSNFGISVAQSHGVPEICVFLHPEMLKFCVVGELSCWGCELEIEC